MSHSKLVLPLSVVLILAASAFGQSTGTPVTNPAKPPTTTTSPNVPPTTNRQPTNDTSLDPFGNTGGGIKGRLVPSPGSRLMVELYQDGSRIDTVFSDTDGSFRFARAYQGQRYEVRVMLGPDAEFREEISFDSNFPAMVQINNLNKIHSLTPGAVPSGGIVSMANLKAPKKAQQEVEKGRDAGQKKKFEEGITHLQKAVEIYPNYPEAYNEMGLILRRQDHLEEAEAMFRKAIDADPKWSAPYLNMAPILANKKDYAELLKAAGKVIDVDPANKAGHYFAGVGNMATGKLDAAEKELLIAAKTEKDQPNQNPFPQAHLLLARIYESRGNTADAVASYKTYLKLAPQSSGAADITQHIAKLEHP